MKIKNLLTVMTGLALFCLVGCASPQKEAAAKEYAPIEVAVPERIRCQTPYIPWSQGV